MKIDQLFNNKPKEKANDIIQMVSKASGFTIDEIKGESRTQNLSDVRHVAMYLCREFTPLSLMDIGNIFGGRDHGTIIHAVKKIKKYVDDPEKLLNDIKNKSKS